jgi:hypothetical protein
MDPKDTDDQVDPNAVIDDEDVGGDPLDDEDDLPLDDEDTDGDDEDEDDETEGNADPAAAAPQGDGKQPSRRTIRVQKLEKERDAERTRATELQNRLNEVLTAQRQPQDDAARRAEEARVAAMDPLERKDYDQQRKIDALTQQVSNLGFAQADGLDRARFEAKAELNSVYKKYAASVESTLQEMRAKGVNTTREALLTYKLGEAHRKKLEAGAGEGQRRKAAAQARVNKVNGRPANLRGDNSGSGKGKTEEDRLRGVQI